MFFQVLFRRVTPIRVYTVRGVTSWIDLIRAVSLRLQINSQTGPYGNYNSNTAYTSKVQ